MSGPVMRPRRRRKPPFRGLSRGADDGSRRTATGGPPPESRQHTLPNRDNTPCRIATTHPANVKDPGQEPGVFHIGADDGIRTRDPHLGKVMLYQLSHVRV